MVKCLELMRVELEDLGSIPDLSIVGYEVHLRKFEFFMKCTN